MANQYRSDEQLQTWIAETKRNQTRLAAGLLIGAMVAIVAWQFHSLIGKGLLFAVVVTGVCGFWITSSHIADWRSQLRVRNQGTPKI